jgi:hypothetical protein
MPKIDKQREERLAAALRENLRRRKDKLRGKDQNSDETPLANE